MRENDFARRPGESMRRFKDRMKSCERDAFSQQEIERENEANRRAALTPRELLWEARTDDDYRLLVEKLVERVEMLEELVEEALSLRAEEMV